MRQYRGICSELGNRLNDEMAGKLTSYFCSFAFGGAIGAAFEYQSNGLSTLDEALSGITIGAGLGLLGFIMGAFVHIPTSFALSTLKIAPREGSKITQGIQLATYAATLAVGLSLANDIKDNTVAENDISLTNSNITPASFVIHDPSRSGQSEPALSPIQYRLS